QGTNEQRIADFYRSFMNEALIEEIGLGAVSSELKQIDDLENHEDVWRHFGYLGTKGISTPIGLFVSQDAGDATQYICQLVQSGTSLPDRDYYLKEDESSKESRLALMDYIATLCKLADLGNGEATADQILALETELAEISWERVKLRNAKARYNKVSFQKLGELTGGQLDWEAYFAASQVNSQIGGAPAEVNVNTPSFFEEFATKFQKTPVETWKKYLRYKVLDTAAPFLTKEFVTANFELYQKQLAGIPEQLPRWKQAVYAISGQGGGDFGALGEAVGQVYVQQYFRPEAKAEMEKLVDNLLKAFGQSIDELSWMTDTTKAKAKEKLAKIETKIGYPDVWRSYEGYEVRVDDLFGNVMRSNLFEHQRNIGKLGKPIDRNEWGMTPQTVNAYYNPSKNEIVFPAAILQPPFFGQKTPAPLNYGGIGAVIGHEISHAFDDQGSQYDGDGNLNNWWTDEDRKAFKVLTEKLISQYAEYSPLPERNVNGQLTLGENIADLSGLAISYKAMNIALAGEPETKVAGWNPSQLFFVGWSRVWQRKYRDSEMVKRLLTDPHSPSQYRANGPVTNIDAFYEAFDVKPGDKLFKAEEDRIKIW
ncbi:MAG: M13-type metalloendopeptidase, partial [Planctomycetota bacterium]